MSASENTLASIIKNLWFNSNLFKWKESSREETYSIDTPPPTISGSLHMGHIFSYSHADFIARFQRTMGKDVFYPIGFDNNGLPTERLVEKIHNIRAREAGAEIFNSKCLEVIKESEAEFEKLFKAIGFSFDWSLKYDTINPEVQQIAHDSYRDLLEKNLIKINHNSPVYWDTEDRTVLAQADLEDKEIDSDECYLRFKIYNPEKDKNKSIDSLSEVVVMTTRPELLPACKAVMYHPEDIRFNTITEHITAATTLTTISECTTFSPNAGLKYYKISTSDTTEIECQSAILSGDNSLQNNQKKWAIVPLPQTENTEAKNYYAVPFVPSFNVKKEKGTGLVMCCTYGDWQDVDWSLEIEEFIVQNNQAHGLFLTKNQDLWQEDFLLNNQDKEQDTTISSNNLTDESDFMPYVPSSRRIIIDESGKIDSNIYNAQFMKDESVLAIGDKKKVQQIRLELIEKLKQSELIIHHCKNKHAVKCGERSGKPVEILHKDAININLTEPIIVTENGNQKPTEAIEKLSQMIKFHPENMRSRLTQWIGGINRDWTISRNRSFGIPIPQYKTFIEDTNDDVLQSNTQEHQIEIDITQEIKNFETAKNTSNLSKPLSSQNIKSTDIEQNCIISSNNTDSDCKKSDKNSLQKKNNLVFDTWFTSSLSPQINAGLINRAAGNMQSKNSIMQTKYSKIYPMDLRPQAHEIIRTWTFYTIAKGLLHNSEKKSTTDLKYPIQPELAIPWKNVMLSGWCLAEDKTKMSKSKGNIVTPLPLIEEKGADVVRYWTATSNLGCDTTYNTTKFRDGERLIAKLRNVGKFYTIQKANIHNLDLQNITSIMDIWCLNRLLSVYQEMQEHFYAYEYCKAREVVERFFWDDFCDNYLEIIKARAYGSDAFLYRSKKYESISKSDKMVKQQSAITTLHYVFVGILHMLSPIISFATEEIYLRDVLNLQQLIIDDSQENLINIEQFSIHKRGSMKEFFDHIIRSSHCIKSTSDSLAKDALNEIGNKFLEEMSLVRKYKSEKNLSIKTELPEWQLSVLRMADLSLQDIEMDFRAVNNIVEGEILENGNKN